MKTFLISIFMLTATVLFAQERNPFPKTITVSGSAEMQITPDEIYVLVDLKEYDKKGQGKITIDNIRQDFLQAVHSLGIPDTAVSIASYDGYNGNPWLRKKNKKTELYSSITYEVKLRKSAQVDALVDKLDDNATQNFVIERTSHSKMEEFRKQLKIEAVKAAKEKAQYLAEAINEHVGEAVTINEPMEFDPVPIYRTYNMSNKMLSDQSTTPQVDQADFKKLTLKFNVNVVFALK